MGTSSFLFAYVSIGCFTLGSHWGAVRCVVEGAELMAARRLGPRGRVCVVFCVCNLAWLTAPPSCPRGVKFSHSSERVSITRFSCW